MLRSLINSCKSSTVWAPMLSSWFKMMRASTRLRAASNCDFLPRMYFNTFLMVRVVVIVVNGVILSSCATAYEFDLGQGEQSLLVLPEKPTAKTTVRVNGQTILAHKTVKSLRLTGLNGGGEVQLLYLSVDETRKSDIVLDTSLTIVADQQISVAVPPNRPLAVIKAVVYSAALAALIILIL